MKHIAAIVLAALALSFPALAQERTPAPEGAQVYIISPQDGATVSSPVMVVFGLKGMGVAPAGVEKEKTGHHHLVGHDPILIAVILVKSE